MILKLTELCIFNDTEGATKMSNYVTDRQYYREQRSFTYYMGIKLCDWLSILQGMTVVMWLTINITGNNRYLHTTWALSYVTDRQHYREWL